MLRNPMTLMDATGQINDQVALSFAQSNLSYIEQGIYRTRYPTFDYARHVPVDTEGNQWQASSTWYAMDTQGEAKFISGQSTDIPFVGMTRNQFNAPVYMIGSGWTWNIEELNQAAIAGVNISAELPATSRRVVERKLYDIAMVGTTEKGAGFTGLINDGTVTSYTVAATGTGSSTFWSNKTPDQILFDVNTLLGGIPTATNNVEQADTLRLPPSAFRYLSSTRLGTNGDSITILEFLRLNNIYTAETQQPLDIGTIQELETAGASGDGRMIAYRRSPEVVRFKLPMPFTILPVRSRSILSYEAAGIARTGGTQIRLPGAVRYADRITDG